MSSDDIQTHIHSIVGSQIMLDTPRKYDTLFVVAAFIIQTFNMILYKS
jgi:hypothetical protein